jgi:hypothetical protein
MSDLPQQTTINQYLADGVTTIYDYSFLILSATNTENDISVYVTLSGNTANPLVDIQPLNTAYTVQNVGNVSGGTITFQPGFVPPISSVVTIVRTMAVSIDTEFSQAQNFNGANLDYAFERVVLIMQQLNTYYMNNALSYVINSYLPTLGQNFLPVLTNINNQVWISQGGVIIAAALVEDNMSTLRAQLASAAPGGDGASLIGFYDTVNNDSTNLDIFLNTFPRPNYGNIIIGGNMTTNPFQRGTTFSDLTGAQYVADRFKYITAGTPTATVASSVENDSPTVQQSGLFGTQSLMLACSTAQATITAAQYMGLQYIIEGYDFVYIAQRNFTFSFWVKTNLPGTYCVTFGDSNASQSYVAPFIISGSQVWQQISITVPASPVSGTWNYTNGAGLIITFTLAAGSNYQTSGNAWAAGNYGSVSSQINFMSSNTNEIRFDRFQINPGNLTTPWISRTIQEELALCQRYFQMTYDLGTVPGTATGAGQRFYSPPADIGNSSLITSDNFSQILRVNAATTVFYSPSSGSAGYIYDPTAGGDVAVVSSGSTMNQYGINTGSGASVSDGDILHYHYTVNADF